MPTLPALQPPWYVLTGGPSAGKTTLLVELTRQGYRTVAEAARAYVDSELKKGHSIEEIRSDEASFQRKVLSLKREEEGRTPREAVVFFDRGMHDTIAYLRALGINVDEAMARDVVGSSSYKKVFLLDMLEFKSDGVRTESPERAWQIHGLLRDAYEMFGIPIISVPILPVARRVEFVLDNL